MQRKTRIRLRRSERAWLKAYRQELLAKYADLVDEMIVYGSKARGDSGPESDLDVLLVVKNKAKGRKRELRELGHLLAAGTDVLSSIMVYTRREWDERKESGSSFRRNIERDGGTRAVNRKLVLAEWRKAQRALESALVLSREGYPGRCHLARLLCSFSWRQDLPCT
jgi:predicted nucleotidyltransferase